jgi:abortive infection bacteriophage resistance protein
MLNEGYAYGKYWLVVTLSGGSMSSGSIGYSSQLHSLSYCLQNKFASFNETALSLSLIRPATPLFTSAPRRVFFFEAMKYNKPPLSIADQITRLETRGLIFGDKAKAQHYLSHISFYRLRAYTFPYQDNQSPTHPFRIKISFERIIEDYILDRKLRIIVFDALEKIEIALRTQIIYQYSLSYGSHWFENPKMFKDKTLHQRDIINLDKEIKRSQEDFILHYRKKYTSPKRPPAWMALEVSTLGSLSKLYDNLAISDEKKRVARHFGLGHPKLLESWMKTFSYTRNICAHHSRLWNRGITIRPAIPNRPADKWISLEKISGSQRIFVTLCCIRYILNRISPGNNFNNKIQQLLAECPNADLDAMGFSPNWKDEPLWS